MVAKKSYSFLLICLVTGLVSCHDHDPKPVICSCEAKVSSDFNGIEGIMVSTTEGYRFLSPYAGYYEVCDNLDPELALDGLMISATGQLKSTCLMPEDELKTIELSFVDLESWTLAQDSLFNQFPIKIKIIKSEYEGYDPGFGYDVQTSDGGFHIIQTHLPAVGGLKPFRTKTDAFKTAVLVAYKLNSDMGLPTLTVWDLTYLQVIY